MIRVRAELETIRFHRALPFVSDWEKTNPMSAANDPENQKENQRASSEIVASDPSVFKQNVKYEAQPNIFTHRPPTPVKPREPEEPIFVPNTQVESEEEHGSTTSEMSGHDSESIYETIRVFTPRKQREWGDRDGTT